MWDGTYNKLSESWGSLNRGDPVLLPILVFSNEIDMQNNGVDFTKLHTEYAV